MKAFVPLLALAAGSLHADLYVTNFQTLNAAGATGVWRNYDTSTDLAFPVSLSQTGGTVQPADGSSTSSILESETVVNPQDNPTWQDVPVVIPFTPGINCFEPNFIGDYINIETAQNATTTVTLDFGASITDPILYLTDVEYRTTLTFPSPFTVLAGTSNLQVTSTTLSSDGTTAAGDPVPPLPAVFEEEAAGSIQFSGTFESLTFTVAVAVGNASVATEDRTGYCVATTTAPAAVSGDAPELSISRNGGLITLTWPIGEFDEIQWSGAGAGVSGWTAIPGLNPSATNTWSSNVSTLGDDRFFRGVYTP